ncbi:DNA ligase 1-like [Tropilaelaps mercedesae]|uniref:DNA ligase n=1 Tax=Tropilaelaps mercedesae TaxID=418985 RepID=A0A1V9XYG3_9ACAR|nr:DNA ligase 1-like [Tropilaelaps mercedesae]
MFGIVFRLVPYVSQFLAASLAFDACAGFKPSRFGAIFAHFNQRLTQPFASSKRRVSPVRRSDYFVHTYPRQKMSQAKISSFFGRKKETAASPVKETGTKKKDFDESTPSIGDDSSSNGDSLVEAPKRRRKSRIIDSSEDEPSPLKGSSNANKPSVKDSRHVSGEKLNVGDRESVDKKTSVKRKLSTEHTDYEKTHPSKRASKTDLRSDVKNDKANENRKSQLSKTSPKLKQDRSAGTSSDEDEDKPDGTKGDENKNLADNAEDGPKKRTTFRNAAFSGKTNLNEYHPDKDKYDPIADAPWKEGEKIPYLAFCRTLECIDEHSSRLKMIEVLRNFFRSCVALSPNDFIYAVYLCLNKTAPDYEGQELGIGDSLLMKAIAEVTGRTLDAIKKEVHVKGDLGMVAESSKTNQKMIFAPPKLLLCNVFGRLKQITQLSGHSVQSKKVDIIKSMFVACRGPESKFLIRSLTGKLRIGLAESSVLTALAHAVTLHAQPKLAKTLGTESTKKILEEATLTLKTVYSECPNYDKIIDVLLKDGFEALEEKCKITPGVPMKPMLAHPTKGVAEVLKRFENMSFTCEFKYDGERAQIHMTEAGRLSIFSRNQENNTAKYPDIIQRITKNVKESVTDFIMDSEAVAYDREKKQILPFQTLMHRKKKDVGHGEITIQVCVFAFDLLYFNGRSLVKEPFRERRRLLREHFNEVEGEFGFAVSADLENVDDIQEFLDESIKGNCEGLMVKTLDKEATYEIAKRSRNWLKLKKDYLEGVGDTIDVVVIGGWKGKGKRTGTYGGFLLACYDPESEEFQSLCKIGTGFKEEELEQHTSFFKNHVLDKAKSYYNVDSSLQPDDWFDAVQVWEIKCADLSISPLHKAAIGLVDPEKGISLRFPRFVRIRDDKKPEDATQAVQIASMYRSQEQVKNSGLAGTIDEEDFY